MRRLFKSVWILSIVLLFFLLFLPYISPRYKGLLNNFVQPILPDLSQKLYSESELIQENQKLREQLQAYESRQDYWDTLFTENQKLRELQNLRPRDGFTSISAQVIVRNPLTGKNRFIIDKGEDDGMKLGMPVMVGKILFGRIVDVKKSHSTVGTLAMQNVLVSCMIQGTESIGQLGGENNPSEDGRLFCRLTWLERDDEIKPGMVVLTSGLSSENDLRHSGSGLIPGNIYVGLVKGVKRNEKFQEATVELGVTWNGFKHVTVLQKISP